jgi:hypothetical protein
MSQETHDRTRFLPVPADFRKEVEQALADKQRGDLALLALETRGFSWGVEGLRIVGRAQLKLSDFQGARSSWEVVRDRYPEDGEANTLLATLYRRLGKSKENNAAALEVEQPREVLEAQEQTPPPHVFVFTGHRIDDDEREKQGRRQRFPPEMEGVAREAIKAAILFELGEGNTNAVGIAGGASGGDILFHEVCAELKIPTLLYLALPRADYVKASVQNAGPDWVRRFDKLYDTLERRELAVSKDLPRWLREKGDGYTIWQRSNLWMLCNAIALDTKGGGMNLTLIALWNGKPGDGAGGTEDMIEQAKKHEAKTTILPTEKLFGLAD